MVNAAANQHSNVLAFLLKNGGDINGKCSSGTTALFYAAKTNHLENVKVYSSEFSCGLEVVIHGELSISPHSF